MHQPIMQACADLQSLPYLCESEIFKRLHEMVRVHNKTQTHLRDRVRHGPLNTLDSLTFQYIKALRQVIRAKSNADSDILPPLYTNRIEVAKLTHGGQRTIYDHLEQLERCGFVRRKFRGRQHDFALWINPWILFGDAYPRPIIMDLSTSEIIGFDRFIRPSSPPQSTLEKNLNCLKSGVNSVDKIIPAVLANISPPNSRSNNFELERGKSLNDLPATDTLEGTGGGRAAAPNLLNILARPAGSESVNSQTNQDSNSKPPDNQSELVNYQKNLVRNFWETARQKCWPNDSFSEQHTTDIYRLIWTDVFLNFKECPNKEKSVKRYRNKLEQLNKAERYALKHKWKSFIAPKKYFCLKHFAKQQEENTKGNFHFTTAWWERDNYLFECETRKRIVTNAVENVIMERKPRGYAGEGKSLDLWAYYQRELQKKHFGPELIADFNQRISQHNFITRYQQLAFIA